jgi:hypothetical protein
MTLPSPSDHADMRVTTLAAVFAEIHLEPANFFKPQLVEQFSSGPLGDRVQIYANLFSIRGLDCSLYECRRRSFLPTCFHGSNIHEHCRILVSLCQQDPPDTVTNNNASVHAARHCEAL